MDSALNPDRAALRRVTARSGRTLRVLARGACLALLATAPWAAALAQVRVEEPWVRGTVDGQMGTGAFMRITAPAAARLVEASSPVAGVVEIHEMRLENNVMRMRAIEALELPAGRAVELRPGGYHVMLLDLKRTLKAGETVPVTLVIETAGRRETLTLEAPVRSPFARPGTPAGK